MQSWQYEIGDILRIKYKGQEAIARIAGYEDSLNNSTALYVNLPVPSGKRWSKPHIKIYNTNILEKVQTS